MQDVTILDVRGRVQTNLQSKRKDGTRLEMSEYLSDYETYLEGHIPGIAHIFGIRRARTTAVLCHACMHRPSQTCTVLRWQTVCWVV